MTTIRRYEVEDVEQIKALITSIMSEEFHEDSEAYPAGDIEEIKKAYGNVGEAFFVAVDGKKIVGTVAIKKEDERTAFLRRLFVASDYRNKKIGRKLIDKALRFSREVGYEEIVFRTTSRMEKAIALCKK